MIRANDLVVVIPDYCQLPSPDKALDVVFKYMHSRPALYCGEYRSYRWKNAKRNTIGSWKYVRLFNDGVDIPYFSGGRDLYIMQVKSYQYISQLWGKLHNVDRYDEYLERLSKSDNPTIRRRAIEECPFEIEGFQNLYPSVDDVKGWLNGFYGAHSHEENIVHTPDSIVEELKEKVLAEFKVGPLPPGYKYKYDSAAYQNIAASREAMKRAENGDHFVDALRYCANDVLVTKELFEIYKKAEENEIMKQNNNIIKATIDGITINQGLGESMSEVELILHLYPSEAHLLKIAADKTVTLRGHRPNISINLDDNCGGAIDLLPGKVKPKKVIFNNPATIVLWNDGTKTIVKKQKGDRYNKEEGLALCYMKKALGNSSRAFNDALHAGLKMGEE